MIDCDAGDDWLGSIMLSNGECDVDVRLIRLNTFCSKEGLTSGEEAKGLLLIFIRWEDVPEGSLTVV